MADRSQPGDTFDVVVLGASVALATGLTEVLLLTLSPLPLTGSNLVSSHVVWTAPLADVAFFAPAALLLAFVHRRSGGRLGRHHVLGAMAFIGSMVVLLMFPQIHRWAKLALALGISVQVARWAARSTDPWALPRRALPWLAAAVVVLTMATQGSSRWRERATASALGPAGEGRPNVLMLILDTVRAESLGLYGRERSTSPRLEGLARDGVTFDLSLAPSPWTLPTHASLFTGRPPHELSIDWQRGLDGAHPTLAEVLARAGYDTGGFVANLYYTNRSWGLDRGFRHYEDFALSIGQVVLDSALGRRASRSEWLRRALGVYDDLNRKSAEAVNAEFLRWLDGARLEARPFFAFLNYFDAHEPYLPPEPYRTMFGPDSVRRPAMISHGRGLGGAYRRDKPDMTPAQVQGELDAYEASIAYLDEQIGVLLDELDRRGLLDNTVVVVTSDHGEQFGEHQRFAHGNSLYAQVLRVPPVLWHPESVPAGVRVADPVSLTDVPTTLLDLVGLDGGHPIPGRSLATRWVGMGGGVAPSRPARPIAASVEVADRPGQWIRAVVDGDLHYIEEWNGSAHLYDIVDDPLERVDLVDSSVYRGETERLHRRIGEVFTEARRRLVSRPADSKSGAAGEGGGGP